MTSTRSTGGQQLEISTSALPATSFLAVLGEFESRGRASVYKLGGGAEPDRGSQKARELVKGLRELERSEHSRPKRGRPPSQKLGQLPKRLRGALGQEQPPSRPERAEPGKILRQSVRLGPPKPRSRRPGRERASRKTATSMKMKKRTTTAKTTPRNLHRSLRSQSAAEAAARKERIRAQPDRGGARGQRRFCSLPEDESRSRERKPLDG